MERIASLFIAISACAAAAAPPASNLVDRVGLNGFLQVEAESFRSLTPQRQQLAYWLCQASIAIDPIIYDQLSRFGLRQKRLLEGIVAHPQKVKPEVLKRILAYTKLFWANRGNRNENTAQKFLPEFTFEELRDAAHAAYAAGAYRGDPYGAPPIRSSDDMLQEAGALRPAFFDPNFEPMVTAKSPRGGMDILQASSNNFYYNVTLADLKNFRETHPLNSRLIKSANGALVEQVYRAGTPDGKIGPGLYAGYLKKAIFYLEKARGFADPEQAAVIANLVRYYQTGDPQDWLRFGASWVRNNATVDFANGFIEVYRDARGAKGTSQSFVSITDERVTAMMRKIADNAEYFEQKAPWAGQYRKLGLKPPLAKAVEALIETGDFHVTTIGDNLPNENEIRQKYGTKSFIFTGSSRAISRAAGYGPLQEFAASPEEAAIGRKYGDEAEDLMTSLHEIIGHGSGKVGPKVTREPSFYLKEYYSTLEEARADLMALWNVWDPKMKELGLVSSPDAAKAMYYNAARVMLTQLRRIPKGDTIEQDHQRNRQLIARYIMDKTGAIAMERRNNKTYVVIRDFEKMRKGVGMLLAELMRIKGEGDYNAIKALVDQYGVRFDPKLRDEIVARYKALNLPTYWTGINPHLSLSGSRVEISYPRDYVKQQLSYAAMHGSY